MNMKHMNCAVYNVFIKKLIFKLLVNLFVLNNKIDIYFSLLNSFYSTVYSLPLTFVCFLSCHLFFVIVELKFSEIFSTDSSQVHSIPVSWNLIQNLLYFKLFNTFYDQITERTLSLFFKPFFFLRKCKTQNFGDFSLMSLLKFTLSLYLEI